MDWLRAVADPTRLHILQALAHAADATIAELAAHGAGSSQTLRRHLEALVSLEVIEERPGDSDGETPGRPATRFRLSPDVRASIREHVGPPPPPGLGYGPGSLTQTL